ncbi:hypothetical protein GLAREA_08533 [Glarea lozoyensis ATCC 20868]|uniref:BTB domain-containing protein n=1 Tax=Glarea lozoyensis (strain ATCC 20868 / MF5171) TaxID=1116229 RepID=S3CFE5_GLAL2|nr:uncharacterized protein GLAREA_08533 [Glarea lozoyensis ATCC 20868]EPE24680.1 hypothetical protein GLAREA_08533 [Glarea lozoyensis ATCC 20868]
MSEPPAKKMRLGFENFAAPLKVTVGGSEKQDFYINKEKICLESDFFKAACKKEWSSGRDNVVDLEDDPDVFAIFLVWLTTGSISAAESLVDIPELPKVPGSKRKLPANIKYESSPEPPTDTEPTPGETRRQLAVKLQQYRMRFFQLLECYYLGDSLQAENFRNYIMDRTVGLLKSRNKFRNMSFEAGEKFTVLASHHLSIMEIYQRTPPNAPLRKLLVDYHLEIIGQTHVNEVALDMEHHPQDYLQDLISQLAKGYYNVAPRVSFCNKRRCTYHNHTKVPKGFVCAATRL